MNNILKSIGKVNPECGFRMDGYKIWGSSVILGEDNRYHMFAARIPAYMRFHPGWMIASDIVRASSDTPEGPYKFEEVVTPARGAQYWDGRSTHNPKIVKYGDKFVLFYMGSTHPFEDITPENSSELTIDSKWAISGRANKRVGIAVSNSIFGPWERLDSPILPTKPETSYSFLTSNPSPVIDKNGKVYLIFKSRKYEDIKHSSMMLNLAVADYIFGPYQVLNTEPLFSETSIGEVEDPFLWHDKDGFHMLAKDQQGTITGTDSGNGLLAHSEDCLNWKLDDSPLAYTKDITWIDGTKTHLGNMERVFGLQNEEGKLTHLFFAVWEGSSSFCEECPEAISWNMAVPLNNQ